MRLLILSFGVAPILIAATAAAQDRPPLVPTRDVTVTYQTQGRAGSGQEMKLSWLTAEQKMRMDLPNGTGWSVTDLRNGRVLIVLEAQRSVMELPVGHPGAAPGNRLQPSPNARFTRGDTETIAGMRCTNWRMQEGSLAGESCITGEGVMLRASGASSASAPGPGGAGRPLSGGLLATSVAFVAQDPARFRPPEGYRTMQMPAPPPR